MGMKICVICNKSLSNRRRKVTPNLTMRCYDCEEPDIDIMVEEKDKKYPVKSTVSKPNYIKKSKTKKKREVEKNTPSVNGEKAKPKHYVKRKKRKKEEHPVIDDSKIEKTEK